jgi:hypothetical protein
MKGGMQKVRFTSAAQIERAPREPRRSGFEIETIPAGTEMLLRPASVRFWMSRGKIEVIDEPRAKVKDEPRVEADEPRAKVTDEPKRRISKRTLRSDAELAVRALEWSDFPQASAHVIDLLGDGSDDILATITAIDDHKAVLQSFLDDVRNGWAVTAFQVAEITDALKTIINELRPPSLRRKNVT